MKLEAQFDSERREIACGAGGPATIHHPLTASRGTVVLVPGWSGTRCGPADLLVFLATRLAQAGWTAVRLDLPGRGDAPGKFAECGLDQMITVAAQTLDQHCAHGPACLLGICSGANVALGAVTLLRPRTATDSGPENQPGQRPRPNCASNDHFASTGVIALSALPFQPARASTFERRRRWKNLKQYAAKALSLQTWCRLLRGEINLERVKKNVAVSEKPAGGERNLKDSVRDIEKELQGWKGPALFIWGEGDDEAQPARAHFEQLHAAGLGRPAMTLFHTVSGANHNFYAQAWREELWQRIQQFLSQCC